QEACGPVMDAAKRAARADKHQKPSADYVEALADAPPKIAGVDVPRCIAWLLRELRAYQARSQESAAMNDLKRILVGLSGAVAQGERCPSAPPVPEDLAALEVGPVIPPIDRYAAAGWRCVRFDTQGAPQHFQYEVRRDGDRYELIARGFPVRGGPAV